MAFIFPWKIKVGEKDSGTIDVSDWLAGEVITSLSVTCPSGGLSILGSVVDGGKLSASYAGVLAGEAEVIFDFNTPTRSDCIKAIAIVLDAC